MLGVPGHILHGIAHFVDRSGHHFHLLGLLLAALLGLEGIVAHLAGRLAQGIGRIEQLRHHPMQFCGEAVEVQPQLGDLVSAVGVQAAGQVAISATDIGHGRDRLL
ncbi:hypothetical protein D3C84_927090 [compost metagenome]